MRRRDLLALRTGGVVGWPGAADVLVWGVPLARGAVPDVSRLVLRDSVGRRWRMQAELQARWDDGSAKWVLLTVPLMARTGDVPRRWQLGTGKAARVGSSRGIRLVSSHRGIRVITDRLRFTVAREGPIVPQIEVRSGRGWRRLASGLDLLMRVERAGGGRGVPRGSGCPHRRDRGAGTAPQRHRGARHACVRGRQNVRALHPPIRGPVRASARAPYSQLRVCWRSGRRFCAEL